MKWVFRTLVFLLLIAACSLVFWYQTKPRISIKSEVIWIEERINPYEDPSIKPLMAKVPKIKITINNNGSGIVSSYLRPIEVEYRHAWKILKKDQFGYCGNGLYRSEIEPFFKLSCTMDLRQQIVDFDEKETGEIYLRYKFEFYYKKYFENPSLLREAGFYQKTLWTDWHRLEKYQLIVGD